MGPRELVGPTSSFNFLGPLEKNKEIYIAASKRTIKRRSLKPKSFFSKGLVHSWMNKAEAAPKVMTCSLNSEILLLAPESDFTSDDSSTKSNSPRKVYRRRSNKKTLSVEASCSRRAEPGLGSMEGEQESDAAMDVFRQDLDSEDTEQQPDLVEEDNRQIVPFEEDFSKEFRSFFNENEVLMDVVDHIEHIVSKENTIPFNPNNSKPISIIYPDM